MAGKRDQALVPLSHDHHHALVIAMLLRRATDENAPGTLHAFLDFWHSDCREHFRVEEEVLFPVFAASQGEDHPLLRKALDDHAEIRGLAAQLEAGERPGGQVLNELGEMLSAHVRLEEREIFPLIEERLPAGDLAVLGERIGESRHPSGDRPHPRDGDRE
ncbi:MAG: hemerythrin domain-containing protein [Actinobacteria bacterium]|nr:hemerythrin domain-containing protein [Actinomycetota bacterium]